MAGSSTVHAPRSTRSPLTPPTLQSLPIEIISQVISYIDKSTALSLARASRHFTPHCDEAIWRELHLSLSDHWGRRPLVASFGEKEEHATRYEWEMIEAAKAEERHGRGLRDKMRVILFRVDERRAGMVKRVKMIPREYSVDSQLQVLNLVGDGLEALDILPPADHILQRVSAPLSKMTLDVKLLHIHLSLPNLTSVTIGRSAMHYMGLLILICDLAPNLASLDVDRCLGEVEDDENLEDDDDESSFPALEQATKLRELRITMTYFAPLRVREVKQILNLLQRSRHLQSLSLDFDGYPASSYAEFRQIVNGYTDLRDLHLLQILPVVHSAHDGAAIGGSARSLTLQEHIWSDIFFYLPNAPDVEAIFLFPDDPEDAPQQQPLPLPTDSAIAQAMTPRFAERLRNCRALRIIHTASETIGEDLSLFSRIHEIERHGILTGVVRSIRHNDHELLHARLLQQYKQISDEVVPTGIDGGTVTQFTYTAHDGSVHLKKFEELPESICVDYTDYEGDVVPLWVLSEMRRVEGTSEAEWVGRGIEVGEAAWKVLTDWRAGMLGGK